MIIAHGLCAIKVKHLVDHGFYYRCLVYGCLWFDIHANTIMINDFTSLTKVIATLKRFEVADITHGNFLLSSITQITLPTDALTQFSYMIRIETCISLTFDFTQGKVCRV